MHVSSRASGRSVSSSAENTPDSRSVRCRPMRAPRARARSAARGRSRPASRSGGYAALRRAVPAPRPAPGPPWRARSASTSTVRWRSTSTSSSYSPSKPRSSRAALHAGVLREQLAHGLLPRPRAWPARRPEPGGERAGRHAQQPLDLDQRVARGAALGLAATGAPVAQRCRAHRVSALHESLVQPGQADSAPAQRLGERLRKTETSHRRRPPPDRRRSDPPHQ